MRRRGEFRSRLPSVAAVSEPPMSGVDNRQRLPGPGFPEACVWTVGYMAAQALAAAGCVLLLLLAAFESWPRDWDRSLQVLLEINVDSSFLLTGVSGLGALFLVAPAVRLRLRHGFRERVGLSPPPLRPLLIASGALLPLAVLSNALYEAAVGQWTAWASQHAALAPLAESNALTRISQQAQSQPFGILVIALALGPAIGEELVFRGLIGSGLVRRWGAPAGVLLTTLLFSGMHAFPPHAIATVPLALFLHYAYLQTRSLWVPVTLHFLNNSLSVALFKLPGVDGFPAAPAVLLTSLLYVGVVAALLWTSHSDRRVVGERDAELPAAVGRIHMRNALACVCILSFTTTFVWSMM